ncbi:MAG: ISNCY family transposase [bacterium]
MARKDIIMLRQRELKRLHIIQKVLDGVLRQVKAAEILSLSERQIRRLIKKVRIEGDIGIAHKSRGKVSNRRLASEIRDKSIELYQERLKGFGPTLAAEKVLEIERIQISDETLRLWLIETGDWKKQRKGRAHRQWRERKHYFGEMVQMDGSHHDWLEGRGPKLVIMAYIDDATSIAYARFYDYEGTIPALDSFKSYIEQYGVPQSLYLDKHTTYKSNAKLTIEEELEGQKEPKSQFERAVEELGVKVIHANSPQAKGRIERLFKTFQDRLIKEMRLKNINTKEGANRFLEGYLLGHNERFGKQPVNMANIHRKIPAGINLESILSIKTKRVLKNDWTISYDNQLYQIKETPPNTRIKSVVVEERIDNTIHLTYNGIELNTKKIEKRPLKPKEEKEQLKIIKMIFLHWITPGGGLR